jgi:histidinol-phosphate aminotransferase
MSRFKPSVHLQAIERTSERHEEREQFICLDRNERAGKMPDAIFREIMQQIAPRDLMAYPDAGPFVAALSAALGFPEAWIAETNGSDAALRRVFMAYLVPGRVVVSLRPSYAMYELYTRIFQGEPRQVDYSADRSFDVDALLAAVKPDVALVILAHPDQPAGTALPVADIRRVVERAAEVDAVCLVDEAYHPFYPLTALPLVREFENMLVTRSFSKYPGCAGIRLGYAVAQPTLIKGLMSVRGGNEVSGPSLAIGRYLVDHPEIAEQFRHDVEQGRRVLVQAGERLGFEALPSVTNFQNLRCPESVDPQTIADRLRRHGYLIKAGFSHPMLARCIRVSLNGLDVMEPFIATLDTVMKEIDAEIGRAAADAGPAKDVSSRNS